MFKHYLTYQFAQSFDRACRHAAVSDPVREKLIHSSTQMLDHFKRGLESEDRKKMASLLFVALLCLRDCMETLEAFGMRVREIEVPFQVLEKRLEQLLSECRAWFYSRQKWHV